jgi:hypothetical protein
MKKLLHSIHSAFAVMLFSFLVGTVLGSGQPAGPVPGRFIVKLKSDVKPELLNKALGGVGNLRKVSNLVVKDRLVGSESWRRFYVFTTSQTSFSTADVTVALGSDNIEFVEPDYYIEFFDFPTDSLFPYQWYLYNTGQQYPGILRQTGPYNDTLIFKSGTPDKDIRLVRQYLTPPSETTKVVVAIVDTGTDLIHPDLQGRFWKNPDEIPGNGIDDDHNGFIDDTLGYDVSGDVIDLLNPVGDNDPTDDFGHGTHIAGIIAANADGQGVVGIAPWVELMPVKIRPNATTAVGAAGIVYAVNAGAQVINISWGTPFESSILREAIDFARRNGVFVCIAPGNTGDNTRFYPAAFDSTFVVAAGNSDGYMTDFSTYGSHIDIVAPGLDILSLRADGTDMYGEYPSLEPGVRIVDSLYYLADGTSMATPMVAGAAALMLSFRPDLTVPELEELLLLGAVDLIDPLNNGDSLIGPDTISGYGYLNIDSSLSLLQRGGLFIVEPVRRSRHTGDFAVKIAPVAGYTGSWRLEYSLGIGSQDWQLLAEGTNVPFDSIVYVFTDTTIEGYINLRVTDKYGSSHVTNLVYVRRNRAEIAAPSDGEELDFNIPIQGSVYGPDYDSMAIYYRKAGGGLTHLTSSTGEFFDSLLFNWSLSGADTGNFTIYLYGYFSAGLILDSVTVRVKATFAVGWPQPIGGLGGMTAVCADLNHDGRKEMIVPTTNGLLLFYADSGTLVDGFPVLVGQDVRCVPAVYDVDGDGQDEIICTSDDGIHVFNYDGTYAAGWPQTCYTGQIPYEYAFPNPVITQLRLHTEDGAVPDSGILIINKIGEILAYRFNGDTYFYSYSETGLFASMGARISDFFGIGGGSSPFVTATNLNGDDFIEVIASHTSPYPYTGLGIFQGANGEPAFGLDSPIVLHIPYVNGTILADLTGDLMPEIIVSGNDTAGVPGIWVKTNGVDDLPGWPVQLPDVAGWIASYPVAADLDLDGVPEILCTYFEYDISALYIFKADGTPYIQRVGRPAGEAYLQPVTFGTPMVANLTGDEYPEIVMRAGYILPGTGPERVYLLDHLAQPLPGWPITTPARSSRVFSSRYAPLVDDIDNDDLVELVLISDGNELLVWNFDASYDNGKNTARFLVDNFNSGIVPPTQTPVGVDDEEQLLPTAFALHQNYPNPFNPHTTISFELSARSKVKLTVYNILGQEVTTLIERDMPAGKHEIEFNGAAYASGVYFYRLETGRSVATRKMLLLK